METREEKMGRKIKRIRDLAQLDREHEAEMEMIRNL